MVVRAFGENKSLFMQPQTPAAPVLSLITNTWNKIKKDYCQVLSLKPFGQTICYHNDGWIVNYRSQETNFEKLPNDVAFSHKLF